MRGFERIMFIFCVLVMGLSVLSFVVALMRGDFVLFFLGGLAWLLAFSLATAGVAGIWKE